jgi:hypothetical protein
VGFAYEAHHHGALLYRFARIFDLEDSALRRAVGPEELVRLTFNPILLRSSIEVVCLQCDGVVIVIVSEHGGQRPSKRPSEEPANTEVRTDCPRKNGPQELNIATGSSTPLNSSPYVYSGLPVAAAVEGKLTVAKWYAFS